MSGGDGARAPGPRSSAALVIACLGLAGCAVGFAFAPLENLDAPLLVVLAACVIATSFLSLDIEGSLFWGGAAIPHVCAFALLGPAPAAVLTAVEEVSVWAVDRYRVRMFPINLFATVTPNMLAGYAIQAAGLEGASYYVLLGVVALCAIALNFLLVTALVGLFYDEPTLPRYARYRRLAAPIAINIAVAVGAVALYRSAGLGATFFVVGGVLVFAYVVKGVALEREHLVRISELADSRGALVAQLLETEDRERRALAQALHDDVIQRLLVLRQDLAESNDDRATNDIDDVVRMLRRTIGATHPSVLDRVGFRNAITTVAEFYAARAGLNVHVAIDGDERGARDRLMFSAARELLANAARHADARRVWVRVWRDGGSVWLSVTDDGRGIDVAQIPSRVQEGHLGLDSLRERVRAVGGSLLLTERAGGGTRAEVRLPEVQSPSRSIGLARELASVSEH